MLKETFYSFGHCDCWWDVQVWRLGGWVVGMKEEGSAGGG